MPYPILMKAVFLVFTLFVIAISGFSNTLVVNNLNDTGLGSLRDIISSAMDDDTIRFNPMLLASGSDTIKLSTHIYIEKRIIVKGLFSATDTLYISGQNLSRVLVVSFPFNATGIRNVVLDSLAIINGNAWTGGGAGLSVSYRLDTLFLRNSIIRNCHGKYGGGIYSSSTTSSTAKSPLLIMSQSAVQNCSATDFGGGICTYFVLMRLINSKVTGNSAQTGAGAYFHAEGPSQIINSSFENNSASLHGGGFYEHINDTVLITGSRFFKNYASINGGAINSVGKLDLTKTVIDSNSAGTRAGGIYFSYFANVMTVDSCTISRNDATFGGGVNTKSKINFNYTTFKENTASQGAGLYFTSTTIHVLGCTFSNNSGNSGSGIYAGQYGTLNVNKSTITNNTANGLGGGIYCYTPYSSSSFSIYNSTVVGNSAPWGAGIAFRTSNIYSLNADFESTIVAANMGENIRSDNDTITSLGYNIFGDTAVFGSQVTDQVNISDSLLSLRTLGDYGGYTQTAPPNKGSVAINTGNPLNTSSAQNIAIKGIRDAGAAESVGVYYDTILTCGSYDWYDSTYSASGDYYHFLPGSGGLDTVATLNLTLSSYTTGVDTVSWCKAYTWIDGVTYTTSNNSATDTLLNSIGCDSIVTLNLTILPVKNGTDTVLACHRFTWIDNITYTTSNNTATDTLIDQNGCDSIVTLNLTILPVRNGTDTVSACNSFTWIDNITYTTSNNSATDTLIDQNGCDSIVTLNLTILPAKNGTDTVSACNSFTWIDNITYTTSNSTATDTLIDQNGCDSIVTLNLTISTSNTRIDQVSACNYYKWIDGITYFTNNNTATHTLTNSNGCDSIISLDLTIRKVNTNVQIMTSELIASALNATYQWVDCDNNFAVLPAETFKTFKPNLNGNYAVVVTENGCTDTSSCYAITDVNLAELRSSNLSIFPNPNNGTFLIEFPDHSFEGTLQITSTIGTIVYHQKIKNEKSLELNLNLAKGVYLLRILSANHTSTHQLLIE